MRLSDLNRYMNTKMVNKPQEVNQESQPERFPMEQHME